MINAIEKYNKKRIHYKALLSNDPKNSSLYKYKLNKYNIAIQKAGATTIEEIDKIIKDIKSKFETNLSYIDMLRQIQNEILKLIENKNYDIEKLNNSIHKIEQEKKKGIYSLLPEYKFNDIDFYYSINTLTTKKISGITEPENSYTEKIIEYRNDIVNFFSNEYKEYKDSIGFGYVKSCDIDLADSIAYYYFELPKRKRRETLITIECIDKKLELRKHEMNEKRSNPIRQTIGGERDSSTITKTYEYAYTKLYDAVIKLFKDNKIEKEKERKEDIIIFFTENSKITDSFAYSNINYELFKEIFKELGLKSWRYHTGYRSKPCEKIYFISNVQANIIIFNAIRKCNDKYIERIGDIQKKIIIGYIRYDANTGLIKMTFKWNPIKYLEIDDISINDFNIYQSIILFCNDPHGQAVITSVMEIDKTFKSDKFKTYIYHAIIQSYENKMVPVIAFAGDFIL